ncbi:hypothetical protein TREMEDRAFT_39318 [Tremella mesenterica DSM 1558]|uniref:uncharacterized protein n=1 Tax=Tremella mesenterica (strain ATCC 24925 / CBS 8224 / DSM 1558 / NBRC 9311 / NRRL Y-6157 / RJB 2259-6 / UBC 559-6) TaxID=578456 RepID=UPI0003F48C2D|nr:uncharacterized protein TREMEDRAFT_39318 [Tremella mesenterica DSM 1558]EIW69000.1 hypothetical protein TREMEDRAFT_39318 [Tremella mesenterica DSM 1558]
MPASLYLRPNPRAFFLLTSDHALVFRHPDTTESKASKSVVVAEFLAMEEVDMRGLVMVSRGRTVEGVLGVTCVPTERSPIPEIFLLLMTDFTPLSPFLPSSSLRPARVLGVEFFSLSSSFWDPPDLVAAINASVALDEWQDPYNPQAYPLSQSSTQSQAQQQGLEHPCAGMKKYLESGGFFFAEECKWDISTRMGDTDWVHAEKGLVKHPLDTFDERFVWNAKLLAPLLNFRSKLPASVKAGLDQQNLLIPVLQGFCGSVPIATGTYTENGRPEIAALGIISRLSWKRAGARFRTRGIDDDGQVANFVETEVVLATSNVCLSYVEVRGSVPMFWQQPSTGLGTLQQKVEIIRPPQATQPAFDKHFLDLMDHYGSIHAVNLLGQRDSEAMLSAAYSDHLASLRQTLEAMPHDGTSPRGDLDLTAYDFHASVRTNGQDAPKHDFSTRLNGPVRSSEKFAWTAIDAETGQIIERQQGVFRVNCLDCLDRTNYVQEVISSIALARFLRSIGSPLATSPTLWNAHRQLWADNGDRLSKIYAGTGALNTSATRSGKKTFAGLLSDATKSMGRAYITNFQDKGKQTSIDMLLGMMAGQRPVVLFDPIGDSVQTALAARVDEYSQTREITIFAGTWNLNGKVRPVADIYMIAFQEIVELTAGQILQTDPAKRRMWEKYIMDTFHARGEKHPEYLLFRSEQLVGTALIIVIRSDLAPNVRNVETATKKTGLQGLSGNKGGVGIRLDLFDSSFCFMTCHLAAGQNNVAERNADYRTISEGLKFLRGKSIEDHDVIIWAADFNYRISLPNGEVRELTASDDIESLVEADQLKLAIEAGEVFHGYQEGIITFLPTYNDNGTDEYDTSEKQRIPSWTDRVLYRGSEVHLETYNRADLRTSDHRPVYAVVRANVKQIDHVKKDQIAEEIMGALRSHDGRIDTKIQNALYGGPATLRNGHKHFPHKAPALPPRPSRTISQSSLNTNPVTRQVPSGSASRYLMSVSQPSTSVESNRRPPPPIPNRIPSTKSISSLTQTSSSSSERRSINNIPRKISNGSVSSTTSRIHAASPTPLMTPTSTGDFILVSSSKNPPPLPSRQGSLPRLSPPSIPKRSNGSPQAVVPLSKTRPSLDLNASPPEGLAAPVLTPDVVKTVKKPVPNVPSKPAKLRGGMSGSEPKHVTPMTT